MKKLPGSLEIKLHEKLSKNDILNVLAEHMTMLEETFGIEEFKLYSFLECYIDSKKQSFYHEEHNTVVNSFNLQGNEKLENTAKIISKDGMMTDGSGGSLSCNVVLWNVLFLLNLVRQCIRSIGKTVTFGFFSQGISVILTVRVRTRNFIPIKGRSSVHPVELRWN